MSNVEIVISGPGGCIEFEAELVIQALQKAGFSVSTETNHKRDSTVEGTEEYMARRHKLLQDRLAQGKEETIHVRINHCPWGG
jgi:hypothetical protein